MFRRDAASSFKRRLQFWPSATLWSPPAPSLCPPPSGSSPSRPAWAASPGCSCRYGRPARAARRRSVRGGGHGVTSRVKNRSQEAQSRRLAVVCWWLSHGAAHVRWRAWVSRAAQSRNNDFWHHHILLVDQSQFSQCDKQLRGNKWPLTVLMLMHPRGGRREGPDSVTNVCVSPQEITAILHSPVRTRVGRGDKTGCYMWQMFCSKWNKTSGCFVWKSVQDLLPWLNVCAWARGFTTPEMNWLQNDSLTSKITKETKMCKE